MKVSKLIIEDVVPLMITYRFDLLDKLIICGFINIITGSNIPRYRPQMHRIAGTIENSQYNYGIKILKEHLELVSEPPRKK